MKFIRIGGETFVKKGLFKRKLYLFYAGALYEVQMISIEEQRIAANASK